MESVIMNIKTETRWGLVRLERGKNMSYTTLSARGLSFIAVCLLGVPVICWADEDQPKRREVRVEVRRNAEFSFAYLVRVTFVMVRK